MRVQKRYRIPEKKAGSVKTRPRKRVAESKSQQSAYELIKGIIAHAESLPPETWEGLPTDLAKNVDHYLYGSPKVD